VLTDARAISTLLGGVVGERGNRCGGASDFEVGRYTVSGSTSACCGATSSARGGSSTSAFESCKKAGASAARASSAGPMAPDFDEGKNSGESESFGSASAVCAAAEGSPAGNASYSVVEGTGARFALRCACTTRYSPSIEADTTAAPCPNVRRTAVQRVCMSLCSVGSALARRAQPIGSTIEAASRPAMCAEPRVLTATACSRRPSKATRVPGSENFPRADVAARTTRVEAPTSGQARSKLRSGRSAIAPLVRRS
jgi:hypothetical protein